MADKATLFALDHAEIAWSVRPVLHNISLRICQGEKVALLGKSGAGKSTLLRHLFRQESKGVAFCPQQPGLVPGLSVYHNIYMGQLDRHNVIYNALNLFFPFQQPLREITSLAAQVGLADKLMAKAECLSGGQQQRVSLARSFYQQQAIFLGDEPVSAVDETQAEALLHQIMAQHETVVIALHNTRHALRYCDRIIGLAEGRIVLDAPSSQLSDAALSEFYQASDSPIHDPQIENPQFTHPAAGC